MAFAPAFELPVVSVGEDVLDSDGSFAAAYGLGAGGAVLVRPDGHVAARWAEAPTDHRAEVGRAIAVALGHVRSSAARPAMTAGQRSVAPEPAPATGHERSLEPARA